MRVAYNRKAPVLTTTTPFLVSVSFESALAGDTAISITGSLITTINDTVTVAESTQGKTYRVLANTTDAGKKPVDITIAMTGYTSIVIHAWVSSQAEEVNTKWTPYLCLIDGYANWRREYPTFTDGVEEMNALRTDIFGSTSLPTGEPYSTAASPVAVNGVTLAHAKKGASTLATYRMNDPDGYYWEEECGYVRNSDNLGVLIIDLLGHGEPGHDSLYTAIMDAGYDYANAALPATTDNPLITESFPGTLHNQILNQGIDRVGFDGRQLFLFHYIRHLTWMLPQRTYSKVVVVGVSGGGQMAALWGGVDDRIDKIFANRGTGAQGQPYGGGDYEQGPNRLFDNLNELGGSIGAVANPRVAESMRNHSRLSWYTTLAANGGAFHHMWHVDDSCCWKGWYNELFGFDLQTYITAQGFTGSYNMQVNTDAEEATHGYSTGDITYIMANI